MASKGGAIRWTPQQLEEFQKKRAGQGAAAPLVKPVPEAPTRRSKYASQKVEQDGITHDSKKEARHWARLQLMLAAGEISDLQRQVPFVLAPAVRLKGEARMKPAIRYVADFVYVRDGVQVIEDIKSAPTRKLPIYRAKKHLMKTTLNLDIDEV